jgi:hypothetical protein
VNIPLTATRANKPKALSTSIKCGGENVKDITCSTCSFGVCQNYALPQLHPLYLAVDLCIPLGWRCGGLFDPGFPSNTLDCPAASCLCLDSSGAISIVLHRAG